MFPPELNKSTTEAVRNNGIWPGSKETPPKDIRRLPRKALPPYTTTLLAGTSILSGSLLVLAIPSLIGASSGVEYLKGGILGLAGMAVAYGTNRLAIEKGAVQAATGSIAAGALSVFTLLGAGGAMFTATFGSFALPTADAAALAEMSQQQVEAISKVRASTHGALELSGKIDAIAEEMTALAECERSSNCFSGGSGSGEGPTYDAISLVASKARQTAAAVDDVLDLQAEFQRDLSNQRSGYERVIVAPDLSISERRAQAAELHDNMAGTAAALGSEITTGLARDLAAQLRSPVAIQGRPDLSNRLSNLLSEHADRLEASTAMNVDRTPDWPEFPERAGVADTFKHIGDLLPIALVLMLAELFPAVFWAYTFLRLRGQLVMSELDAAGKPASRPAPRTRRKTTKEG